MSVETVDISYVGRFAQVSARTMSLVRKSSNEIVRLAKNPQELTPARIVELKRNGEQWLRTLGTTVDTDIERLEQRFADSLHWHQDFSGISIGYTLETPITVVVFPFDSSVFFYHPNRPDSIPSPAKSRAIFIPTTHTLVDPVSQQYPSEGYCDIDTKLPFTSHSKEETPQFGGFLVNNQTRELEVLDFSQTMDESTRTMKQEEVLFATNMYMDSNNQETVCNRPNLTELFEVYNCLGIIYGEHHNRYFTLNSHNFSYKKMLEDRGITPPIKSRKVSVWEMAALSNVVTRAVGGQSWKEGYGEYSQGGTYFDIKSNRYHLMIAS